jgi:uncharacterized protein (TIGR04255 family)
LESHPIPDSSGSSNPLQPITFDFPPVTEVALAMQFERPVIDLEVLGLVAGKLKGEFPQREQQPPLPPMDEPVEPVPPGIQFQIVPPTLPRTWFVSADGHSLVQLQPDRIAVNWRRLAGGQPYPRYTALRTLLARVVELLLEAVNATGAETANVNFCELTYLNEIAPPDAQAGQPHPDLARVVNLLERTSGRTFLPDAEDAQLQIRWRIPATTLPEGTQIGRLYVSVAPGFRADSQVPIYAMNLTARMVPPPTVGARAALEVVDVGHEWIVRGFADLTTEDMHRVWGARN